MEINLPEPFFKDLCEDLKENKSSWRQPTFSALTMNYDVKKFEVGSEGPTIAMVNKITRRRKNVVFSKLLMEESDLHENW